MESYKDRVLKIIRLVPYGMVVSYGQVAAMAGIPRTARQVGRILNATEGDDTLPWWRVINNQGIISIKGTKLNDKNVQRSLLRSEGIVVNDNYELAIEKYRFCPSEALLKQLKLEDVYIEIVMEKFGF